MHTSLTAASTSVCYVIQTEFLHLQMKKKKIWQEAQPLLKTDANKQPNFKGKAMLTSQGPVTSSLENANIS